MLKELLGPDIDELLRKKDYAGLKDGSAEWEAPEAADLLMSLPEEEQPILFRLLPRARAAEVFAYLPMPEQRRLLQSLTTENVRNVLEEAAPDDRARLFGELPAQVTQQLLGLLSAEELSKTRQLLGYPEESVGRLMTPEYVAIHPEWTVGRALEHIRQHGKDAETINMIYVVDYHGKLIDDLRLRKLILADPSEAVATVMDRRFVALSAFTDREEAAKLMQKYDRVALPVTDSDGVLIGIVTVDDIIDVVEKEATEDIQKMAAVEALDEPYLQIGFFRMVKKRAGWLTLLFLGEMLTATAMGYFEREIARAVVLALFIPLIIISSGGNSGSQAASLIIRAMALEEIRLRQWWRVMRREFFSGLALGAVLGSIAFVRIILWPHHATLYGQHYMLVAVTVAASLIGVVTWGSLTGSMLPFIMRRLGFDPAASSAPFVATLVDVTGLVIYFTVAMAILHGTLL
ncbi:MAG: magnesium transporter [candidate division KSB1 bacterium]|nr:magnesium transporter [candidate division KSB1 bacterium]MDZ7364548.1 magnesium transporter [candidate division KSB1 bacterium]MDZ7405749.1 magnesium transporter [candidate division KSB1 bacterium]